MNYLIVLFVAVLMTLATTFALLLSNSLLLAAVANYIAIMGLVIAVDSLRKQRNS